MMHAPCNGPEKSTGHYCLSMECQLNNTYDFPDYMPDLAEKSSIATLETNKTICMSGVHGSGNNRQHHFEVHTSYGMLMSGLTHRACEESRDNRCLVISRSTSVTASMAADSSLQKNLRSIGVWFENEQNEWAAIHKSVIGLLESNLYGISYVGNDVCGYENYSNPSVCKAWIQSMVLSPFFRMRLTYFHQGDFNQNPDIMETLVNTLKFRYMFLPYTYTVFYEAATKGSPVIRPLFYEFQNDENTYNIDNQYMVGEAVMTIAIINEGFIEAYFPDDIWYRLNGHVGSIVTYTNQTMPIGDRSSPQIYIRGGSIIPWLEIDDTLSLSEVNTISLAIFHKSHKSNGIMFWDDGISKDSVSSGKYIELSFHHEQRTLVINRSHFATLTRDLHLKTIFVNNVASSSKVRINGKEGKRPIYDRGSMLLTLEVGINLSAENGTWNVEWSS